MITLDELTNVAQALLEADAAVEAAEEVLKEKKAYARLLREETIPCAMQEVEMQSFKLNTGQTLRTTMDVYSQTSKESLAEVYDWLEEHNFGGLIKTEVVIEYGKGELEQAVELMQKLSDEGLAPALERGVHAQTMKAFLREQISKGADIPLDLFGATPIFTTKISKR